MNIGGIHILGGLFFLGLSSLLIALYLGVIFQLFSTLIKWKNTVFGGDSAAPMGDTMREVIKKSLYFSLIFHLLAYAVFRIDYFGSDNANYKAKEYYVAGLPLSSLRLALATVFNPDDSIVFPLNALQEAMYSFGSKWLPEDDGEIGVWVNKWFLFPYVAFDRKPYGTEGWKPSLKMRALLDRVWFAMETMSTRPFADNQMEYENYLEDFTFLAYYFSIYQGYYHDQKKDSARFLLNQPAHVAKCRLLHGWLLLLRERWIELGYYEEIKEYDPKIEAVRQAVTLYELGRLISGSIFSREFSCNSPYVHEYAESRREFVEESYPNHVLKQYRLTNPHQAENVYLSGTGYYYAAFMKYLLRDYCGIEVPGRMSLGYKNRKAEDRRVRKNVEATFKEEIEILKELYND